jgi:uncharacterized damage-inducible protein DinB
VSVVPGSGWPALIDAFRHFCGAYETWLHRRLGAAAVIVPDPASVVDWRAIAEWRRRTRASFRRVLDDTPDDRFQVVDIPISSGVAMNMSVGDILAHLLLHERGHHGDVSTLFYHFGVELPSMDYRIHLHLKRSATP